jgi:hypothetical protein
MGVVVREVKKLVAGLLWNDRIAGDLNAVFEAPIRAEVSLNGWRIEKAILRRYLVVSINDGCRHGLRFYPLEEAMMSTHLGFKWLESSRSTKGELLLTYPCKCHVIIGQARPD